MRILSLDIVVTSGTTSKAQKTLNAFTVAVEKALPVTKATLKEFCFELIVNADIISLYSYFHDSCNLSFLFSVLLFHELAIL